MRIVRSRVEEGGGGAGEKVVLRYRLEGARATARLGEVLARATRGGTVVGLVGDLGAGKTSLVRAWATGLGVPEEEVTSPTFVLVQHYEGRLRAHHLDAYRLGSAEEFDDLDAEGLFRDEGGATLVEWADRVGDRLPSGAWRIELSHGEANSNPGASGDWEGESLGYRLARLEFPGTAAGRAAGAAVSEGLRGAEGEGVFLLGD